MVAAPFEGILAHQLVRGWMDQAYAPFVPLDLDQPPQQLRRSSIVGAGNLEAPIKMHGPGAVLVIAKWLDRKSSEVGL